MSRQIPISSSGIKTKLGKRPLTISDDDGDDDGPTCKERWMEAREFVSSLEFDESDGEYGWRNSFEYQIEKIPEEGWCWFLSLWREERLDPWGNPSWGSDEKTEGRNHFFGKVSKKQFPPKGSDLEKRSSGQGNAIFNFQLICFECEQENEGYDDDYEPRSVGPQVAMQAPLEHPKQVNDCLPLSDRGEKRTLNAKLSILERAGFYKNIGVFSWDLTSIRPDGRSKQDAMLEELERILS